MFDEVSHRLANQDETNTAQHDNVETMQTTTLNMNISQHNTHTHIQAGIHTYIHTVFNPVNHTHIYTLADIQTGIQAYIHTYGHTHTHTYIHIPARMHTRKSTL